MTVLTINVSPQIPQDTTAPVLSSLTVSATGSTAWAGSVTTDEAGGTLYVLQSANASESASTIKASGAQQDVAQAGTQSISGTGLTAESSYYVHTMQTDAAGNDSAVETSAQFTTPASDGPATASDIYAEAISPYQSAFLANIDASDGTMFAVIQPAADAAPSGTQIESGQDQSGAALAGNLKMSQPIARSGLQVGMNPPSALTPGTAYKIHVAHRTAGGALSSVLSSDSFSTPSATGTGSVTIQVVKRTNLETAPEPVFFRASVTQSGITQAGSRVGWDESFHRVVYVWDFDDPGAVSDKAENLPIAHNDLNRAYGKEAAHVFHAAGTYTVRCSAYLESTGALIGSDTQNITVIDPDVTFAGSKTILVDRDNGNWSAEYPDAQVVTSTGAAWTARHAIKNQNVRILIRRNDTYGSDALSDRDWTHTHIGAFGTGTKPVINTSRFISTGNDNAADYAVFGLNLVGGYNSLTETGEGGYLDQSPGNCFRLMSLDDAVYLIDDCQCEGYDQIIDAPAAYTGGSAYLHVNNCLMTGFADYVIWGGGGMEDDITCHTGNAYVRRAEDLEGGHAMNQGNGQGPVRITGAGRHVFSCTELFNRCGWGGGSPPTHQGNLRNNVNVENNYSIILDRCVLEGGLECIIFDSYKSDARPPVNALLDKCLIVGTTGTNMFIKTSFQGITARNLICIRPNAKNTKNWGQAFLAEESGNQSGTAPLRFYNFTYVNALDETNRNGRDPSSTFSGFGNFSSVETGNGITHTPNATSFQSEDPLLSTALMPTVGGVWASRYVGRKHAGFNSGNLDTSYATPTGAVKDLFPLTGSPVIADATTGTTAHDDFFGFLRASGARNRGALQRVA